MTSKGKGLLLGLLGTWGLLVLYGLTLLLLEGPEAALQLFLARWWWILLISITFGVQVGLIGYMRAYVRNTKTPFTGGVAASGTISTGSMLACCAHHLTDLLPFLGISGVSVFLTRYQVPLLLVALIANIFGIVHMLSVIQQARLYDEGGVLQRIFRWRMRPLRNAILAVSLILLPLGFLFGAEERPDLPFTAERKIVLEPQTKELSGVAITVKPLPFIWEDDLSFEVSFDTHVGSLDFDPREIAVLQDEGGRRYRAHTWEGSPPGGHHRRGRLIFPRLSTPSAHLELTITDVYGDPLLTFLWEIEGSQETP
ncbi:hypothetical protein [Spirochaeta thermophila]|uniref:Uncharacterized protein n=1 Tax=Winmispira thermophila (strain ATCC 49972 / DSM 6192 / RI 19.B1) TaxID=665571 RepID=E0RTR1_WINT6|nr:hypothetical protein [Spirochaeta thermophila]ADN02436.1 hypothetical protein STHERM_c14960 [Spirochaeta thermophila DSM 6192]